MGYTTIEYLIDAPVGTIRLNRPERMNAVVEEMYREIQDALGRATADPTMRCLVLTGSVLRREGVEKQAFCAGADLKKHAAGERGPEERRAYIELTHETTRRIHELPLATIAAINGPARGAGIEMALSCDLLLMAEDATLAFPETGLGTMVGGGVTHVLPRLVGLGRAKELIYTGRVVDGREAVAIGLALACYPVAELGERARSLALELAAKAPVSMERAKRELQRSPGLPLPDALQNETEAIVECMDTADWREGLPAFAETRRPRFEGR